MYLSFLILFKMFLLGLLCGTLCTGYVGFYFVHKKLSTHDLTRSQSNTLELLLLYLEQLYKKSVVFCPEKKVYILSFIMKNRLHRIMILPPKGPLKSDDPYELGYSSIIPYNKNG